MQAQSYSVLRNRAQSSFCPEFLRALLYRDPQIDLIFAKLNDVCEDLGYDATKADVWSLTVIMAQLYLDFDVMFKIFNRVWNEDVFNCWATYSS